MMQWCVALKTVDFVRSTPERGDRIQTARALGVRLLAPQKRLSLQNDQRRIHS